MISISSVDDVEDSERSRPVPANNEAKREVVLFVFERGNAGAGSERGMDRLGSVAAIEKDGQLDKCEEVE